MCHPLSRLCGFDTLLLTVQNGHQCHAGNDTQVKAKTSWPRSQPRRTRLVGSRASVQAFSVPAWDAEAVLLRTGMDCMDWPLQGV